MQAGLVYPARLVQLTFKSQTVYVWTGPGNLVWDGHTFLGVGTLGSIGTINEGVEVTADGTTVTLSGIDPVLLGECLTDIQPGATANIWFALVTPQCTVIGTPYLQFSGCVDVPTVTPGTDTISISLTLESRMLDLARPTCRRYTSADQRLYYPNDSAFGWVEQLNDQALIWGS
jgi:hypothetical protein